MEMQIKTIVRCHFSVTGMTRIKTDDESIWKKWSLIHCRQECTWAAVLEGSLAVSQKDKHKVNI